MLKNNILLPSVFLTQYEIDDSFLLLLQTTQTGVFYTCMKQHSMIFCFSKTNTDNFFKAHFRKMQAILNTDRLNLHYVPKSDLFGKQV